MQAVVESRSGPVFCFWFWAVDPDPKRTQVDTDLRNDDAHRLHGQKCCVNGLRVVRSWSHKFTYYFVPEISNLGPLIYSR